MIRALIAFVLLLLVAVAVAVTLIVVDSRGAEGCDGQDRAPCRAQPRP